MLKNIYKTVLLLLFCPLWPMVGHLSAQVRKNKGDTAHKAIRPPLRDVKSKEVAIEFPCNPDVTVFLENMLRRVNVQTTKGNKVRLVTTVYYQGEPGFTDADWLQKLELDISGDAGNVVVRSGNLNKPGPKSQRASMSVSRSPDTLIANAIAVFDSTGNWVNRKSNIKRNIILYIPLGAKLDIESKYSDISLDSNIREVKAQITNGGLTMRDAVKLVLTSNYGNIYAGNMEDAVVDLSNGNFRAKNIKTVSIDSKNSTIELGITKRLKMDSESDQYEIEGAGVINGRKNYGDLRITSLKTSLDLGGLNADIKIRSIDPGATLIKIDDQYADLRLAMGSLKNYSVDFKGTGTNIYTPFEKTNNTDSSFRTTVGVGKLTDVRLKCNNCSVDLR